ncbi:MAG: nucleotidyltransferase domain-containing protein [Oscillospiraceae bacterium]|nr:nucleotidyltransferase domain-containing protein [Oscillospiraceae bacterium]
MIYTIEQLKEAIAPIAYKYQLPAVYVFGSYARGDATELSDVDILIDRTGTQLRGLLAMGGLHNDLCEVVGKSVDLITTTALEEEDTKRRTPWFIENVNKERIQIYGERGH